VSGRGLCNELIARPEHWAAEPEKITTTTIIIIITNKCTKVIL
jgi:hypothetical protein